VPQYEILFSHSLFLDDPLWVGDAYRHGGDVWQVGEALSSDGDGMRLLLRPWPNDVPHPETIRGESAA
jgi:hypothetical protein